MMALRLQGLNLIKTKINVSYKKKYSKRCSNVTKVPAKNESEIKPGLLIESRNFLFQEE